MTDDARALMELDAAAETQRICAEMRIGIARTLRRQGAVVAISGGVDSSVTAALAVRALGKDRVFGLMLPDRESSSDSSRLGASIVDQLGIRSESRDITPILESFGCYEHRDRAYRDTISDYGSGWTAKIVLPSLAEGRLRYFTLVARGPDGIEHRRRLAPAAYLRIVAAMNYKQRVRKMLEYFHADRLNYAVCGTPNRLERDQGFYVKAGDGAADIMPIAHLYKSQVYQLAEYLDIPHEVRSRTPTSDTYSLAQSQQEFFFSLPYEQMDICLYAHDHQIDARRTAELADLPPMLVERAFSDIEQKRRSAAYLREPAITFFP